MIPALTDRATLWLVRICETVCVLITACALLALNILHKGTLIGWFLLLLVVIVVDVPAYFLLKKWLASRLPRETDEQFIESLGNLDGLPSGILVRTRAKVAKELGLPPCCLSSNLRLSTLRHQANVFGTMEGQIGDLCEDIIEEFAKRGQPCPSLETIGDVVRALSSLETSANGIR